MEKQTEREVVITDEPFAAEKQSPTSSGRFRQQPNKIPMGSSQAGLLLSLSAHSYTAPEDGGSTASS